MESLTPPFCLYVLFRLIGIYSLIVKEVEWGYETEKLILKAHTYFRETYFILSLTFVSFYFLLTEMWYYSCYRWCTSCRDCLAASINSDITANPDQDPEAILLTNISLGIFPSAFFNSVALKILLRPSAPLKGRQTHAHVIKLFIWTLCVYVRCIYYLSINLYA